jgi:hypothetical protein
VTSHHLVVLMGYDSAELWWFVVRPSQNSNRPYIILSRTTFRSGTAPQRITVRVEPDPKHRTGTQVPASPKKNHPPHNSRTGYFMGLLKSALDSSRENLRWQSKSLLWIKTRKNYGHLKSVFWLQNQGHFTSAFKFIMALKAHSTWTYGGAFRSCFGSAVRAEEVWEVCVCRIPHFKYFFWCRVSDCGGNRVLWGPK